MLHPRLLTRAEFIGLPSEKSLSGAEQINRWIARWEMKATAFQLDQATIS